MISASDTRNKNKEERDWWWFVNVVVSCPLESVIVTSVNSSMETWDSSLILIVVHQGDNTIPDQYNDLMRNFCDNCSSRQASLALSDTFFR